MTLAFWTEVLDLRDRVERAAERAAHELRSSSADVDATSRSALILSTLHMDVRHALERYVTTSLEAQPRRADADHLVDRALRLVSFWLNERIRRRLPAADRADWQPVGPAGVELRNGGRQFFRDVDEVLAELGRSALGERSRSSAVSTAEAQADLALFCLEDGFKGELAGSPRGLEEYKARLRRPRPSTTATPDVPEASATLEGVPWAPRVVSALGVGLLFYGLCAAALGWWGGP